MNISNRLVQLRKEHNLSREELSKKIGVSYSTVSKYETGSREPDLDMINRLAELFDVTTDYLIGRSDHPKSELGKKLKKARSDSGLKQIDAAAKLDISNGTLSGYERNYRDPDTDILNRMARLYKVSVDWLLDESTVPKNKREQFDNERDDIIHKIATEFPDADLMFNDLAGMTADDLEEVYEFIKFKSQQNK